MNKLYREKKAALKDSKSNKIVAKYGGQQYMADAPPKELLYAQTEQYVEYDRSGGVVKGNEKATATSKYEEDVLTHNHTAVWGSFYDTKTMRWGYADDHSTTRNSYSTGEAGKRARAIAAATSGAGGAGEGDRADADAPAAGGGALPHRMLFGMNEELGETPLDEAKVKAAMVAARERDAVATSDDRKRKYNSMTADDTSAEAMEAYYRSKARADDPMANF